MNIFDEARAIDAMLRARAITQKTLAKILGVSQPYIANKLRLLALGEEMQEKILESGVSERHARTLLRLPEEMRGEGLRKIVEGKMSVAQAEIMTDCMLEEALSASSPKGINTAERIGRFEKILESSIANLRLFGISATQKRETYHGNIYITVCIEQK